MSTPRNSSTNAQPATNGPTKKKSGGFSTSAANTAHLYQRGAEPKNSPPNAASTRIRLAASRRAIGNQEPETSGDPFGGRRLDDDRDQDTHEDDRGEHVGVRRPR